MRGANIIKIFFVRTVIFLCILSCLEGRHLRGMNNNDKAYTYFLRNIFMERIALSMELIVNNFPMAVTVMNDLALGAIQKREFVAPVLPIDCPEDVSRHDCYNNLMSVWIRRLMIQDNTKDS